MLRQEAPLALAFCVAPAASVAPLVAAHAFPLQVAHEAMYETLHEATVGAVARSAAGDVSRVEALSAGLDDLAAEHWLLQRLASVRQRPFQLRIQAASAARLRDDFLLSLAGEVGGPGRLTAKAAWQTPALPLAAGAQVVRPRTAQSLSRREACAALAALAARDAESENVQENVPSKRRRAPGAARMTASDAGLPESCAVESDTRTTKASDQPHAASRGCDEADEKPNRARTEAEVALCNFALLGFDAWGEDTLPAAEVGLAALADLGEVTRLLSLPLSAPWLPVQSAALALPFRAGRAEGLRLGVNNVRDAGRPVQFPLASRAHHLWIVGQTGTGKTTLLESLVLQDIAAGRSVLLIDPHGDLIEQVLGKIPATPRQRRDSLRSRRHCFPAGTQSAARRRPRMSRRKSSARSSGCCASSSIRRRRASSGRASSTPRATVCSR